MEQALAFLQGAKISDEMPADLRRALYVERRVLETAGGGTLEQRAAEALCNGIPVVVTGSAGGGKTAFLQKVEELLDAAAVDVERARTLDEFECRASRDSAGPRVWVIPDLTAAGNASQRQQLLDRTLDDGTLLLASNEGILHLTELPGRIADVADCLREMQRGATFQQRGYVLVDLAGLDPLSSLVDLLTMPLLHDAARAAETSRGECNDLEECPRLRNLSQLRAVPVAEALSAIVRVAVGPGETLFSGVWEFVADLFLGGSCAEMPETSPWPWRLFEGDTEIAKRMSASLEPQHVALPALAHLLYEGRWPEIAETLEGLGAHFVEPVLAPRQLEEPEQALALMLSLKTQCMVLLRARDAVSAPRFWVEVPRALDANGTGGGSAVQALVRAINAYFRRGAVRADDDPTLELWVELSTERRTNRAANLLSLGRISSTKLEIRRSRVLAGLEGVSVPGSRRFLAATDSIEVLLELDSQLLEALNRGRFRKMSERANDDTDYALREFFLRLSATAPSEDASGVVRMLSWTPLQGTRVRRWDITDSGLEERGA